MENKKFIFFISLAMVAIILAAGGFFLFGETKKEIYFSENKNQEITTEGKTEEPTMENKNIQEGEKNSVEAQEIKKEELVKSSDNAETLLKKEIKNKPEIVKKLASWGFSKSEGRKIDTIIIHSTYNPLGGDEFDPGKIIEIYKSYGVAPHYLFARNGKIYQLVEEKNIAYHAGVFSVPDGRTNVNNFSIGIEIINSKSEGPSPEQYESLKKLVEYLKSAYAIKYVIGHSDIAPGRKDDPWKFDWNKIK